MNRSASAFALIFICATAAHAQPQDGRPTRFSEVKDEILGSIVVKMCGDRKPMWTGPTGGDQFVEAASQREAQGDHVDAVKRYVAAARSGSSKAAIRLSQIYARGAPGVPSDKTESLAWARAASMLAETESRSTSPTAQNSEAPAIAQNAKGPNRC